MPDPTPDLGAAVGRVRQLSANLNKYGQTQHGADLDELLSALSRLESERDAQVDVTLALQAELATAKATERAAVLTALRAEVEGMLHAIPPRNDGETPTDWCIRVNDWEEQNVAIQRILAAIDARRGA